MGTAATIVLILNVLAIGAGIWTAWSVRRHIQDWVSAAISEEVRKQDDRISKRIQRAEGQPLDALPTDSDREKYINNYRAGQPMRRG